MRFALPFSDISACSLRPRPLGANLLLLMYAWVSGYHVFWGELAELPVAGRVGPWMGPKHTFHCPHQPSGLFPSLGYLQTGQAGSHPDKGPRSGLELTTLPLSWAGREILEARWKTPSPKPVHTHTLILTTAGKE